MMETNRLEAFSDGVLAIIITIMVLEMKAPHGTEIAALRPMLPIFLSYVLSFIYVGIYWNNHHHLLHAAQTINGAVLWANLHLLFWLSLVPFVTAWMGENHFSVWPIALYGVVLLMAAIAYYILVRFLLRQQGNESCLAPALNNDTKGKVSVVLYLVGIVFAFIHPWLAFAVYIGVAIMWFVPDRRLERHELQP